MDLGLWTLDFGLWTIQLAKPLRRCIRKLCEDRLCQKIDNEAVYDVDQDINKMIAENIQFPEFVIERKSETNNGPGSQQAPRRRIVRQSSDRGVFFNSNPVIKYEWTLVNIAVNNQRQDRYED